MGSGALGRHTGSTMTKSGCKECSPEGTRTLFGYAGAAVVLLLLLMILVRKTISCLNAHSKRADRVEEDKEEGEEVQHGQVNLHSKRTAADRWRRARFVKHMTGLHMTAEMQAASHKIGMEELRQAANDATVIVSHMRRGFGDGKTQMKISVGLAQILGKCLLYASPVLSFLTALIACAIL